MNKKKQQSNKWQEKKITKAALQTAQVSGNHHLRNYSLCHRSHGI